ncbi:MAG: hypothetical protein ACRD4O_04305 [Bryobacteraceae bacterium]
MKDGAGWLSAIKTACRLGFGSPAEAHCMHARSRQQQDAAFPPLQWPSSAILFVIQRAVDGFIKKALGEVGLNAGIKGLRMLLVKPEIQLFQLRRRKRIDCAFNFLDRAFHGPLRRILAGTALIHAATP